MKKAIAGMLVLAAASCAWAQEPAPDKAAVQQRLGELRAAMAENRAKLKKYQWLQITDTTIKDENKKQEQFQCRYGPDGKVQKTPVGPPPEQKAPPGGLRGKMAGKKIAEMKDYTDRLKSLISHYAPPDPERLKAAAQTGRASVSKDGDVASLSVTDYYKTGDKVTFAFDTAAKKLKTYDVNTYLDDPKKDVVTMTNDFDSLPDGTNYLAKTVLDASGKEIKITTVNQGHSLIPH